MKLMDFDDKIAKERNNNKPIYVNRHLAVSLQELAKLVKKDPKILAEYFLSLGINSAKHCKDQKVIFDVDNL